VVGRNCRLRFRGDRLTALLAMTFWGKCPDKSGDIRDQVSIEIINKQ